MQLRFTLTLSGPFHPSPIKGVRYHRKLSGCGRTSRYVRRVCREGMQMLPLCTRPLPHTHPLPRPLPHTHPQLKVNAGRAHSPSTDRARPSFHPLIASSLGRISATTNCRRCCCGDEHGVAKGWGWGLNGRVLPHGVGECMSQQVSVYARACGRAC